MTRHYLAGDLSLLLGRLQELTPDPARAQQVARLRHETETNAPEELGSVAHRALTLTDDMCWDSLTQGDISAFGRRAELSGDLYEFGVCGELLDGD